MKAYLKMALVLSVLLGSAATQARPIFNITRNIIPLFPASNVVSVLPGKSVNVRFLVQNVSGTAFAGGLSYQANVNATNLFSAAINNVITFHGIKFCGTSMTVSENCQINVTVTAGNQLGTATIRPKVCYLGTVCSMATQPVTIVVTNISPG